MLVQNCTEQFFLSPTICNVILAIIVGYRLLSKQHRFTGISCILIGSCQSPVALFLSPALSHYSPWSILTCSRILQIHSEKVFMQSHLQKLLRESRNFSSSFAGCCQIKILHTEVYYRDTTCSLSRPWREGLLPEIPNLAICSDLRQNRTLLK